MDNSRLYYTIYIFVQKLIVLYSSAYTVTAQSQPRYESDFIPCIAMSANSIDEITGFNFFADVDDLIEPLVEYLNSNSSFGLVQSDPDLVVCCLNSLGKLACKYESRARFVLYIVSLKNLL